MPRFQPNDAPAAQASFATVERFLATDTDHALGTANTINEHALKEAYETVRLQHAPPVVSGADLLDQIEAHTRVLPTGCDSIDAMLEGGCREGQVLELYGDSGSGKTQLCMTACARAAARRERVLYIDSSNAFTANRILTMLKAIPVTKERLEEAVGCITVVPAYTAHAALAALDTLLAPNSTFPKPNLVILDSIGAVIAPVLGAGGSRAHLQGHVVLAAAATLLKQVAKQLHAAVIVTNHMVGGSSGGGDRNLGTAGTSNYNENEFKRPALGESWHHQCHCRVHLATPPAQGHPWTAVLQKSTMLNPGKRVAQYWLTTAGVSATVPPPPPAPGQQ